MKSQCVTCFRPVSAQLGTCDRVCSSLATRSTGDTICQNDTLKPSTPEGTDTYLEVCQVKRVRLQLACVAHTSTKACKSTKERLQGHERQSARERQSERASARMWPDTSRRERVAAYNKT
jgi:hypothetical protein